MRVSDVLRAQSELFRHGLRHDRARAGADVLRARERNDRAVAANPHFAAGGAVNDVRPLRLRHADAALDRTGVRAGRPALRPACALGADASLDLARPRVVRVVRVDLLAQRERIHIELVGQLVERLLEREDSLHLPGRAKRGARAGVGEDVVVLYGAGSGSDTSRCGEADARARGHAAGAVTLDLQRRQRAVALRAELEALNAARPVADADVLLAAIEHQPHRRARLARQVDRERAVVADAELRAEPAAGELADHADLVLRQLEHVRRFVAHAERELRRGVERQLVVAPVRDEAVRLHRRVRLHLRAVFARNDVVGLREALLHVAARDRRRGRHVRVRADCLSAASPEARRRRPQSRLAPSVPERRPARRPASLLRAS